MAVTPLSRTDPSLAIFQVANAEPLNGVHYVISFDGVFSGYGSKTSKITSHAVPGGTPFADNVVHEPDTYEFDVAIAHRAGWDYSGGTAVVPATDLSSYLPGGGRVVRVPMTTSWRSRALEVTQVLSKLRGVRLKVIDPRHGMLEDMYLTAISDRRGTKIRADFTLSFKVIKRAAAVGTDILPVIPSAVQQAPPEPSPCNLLNTRSDIKKRGKKTLWLSMEEAAQERAAISRGYIFARGAGIVQQHADTAETMGQGDTSWWFYDTSAMLSQ